MEKTAYFKSEKTAQSACKALKKAGEQFRLINNYDTEPLRYITDHNPAGLYSGSGIVKIQGIGLVSGQNTGNQDMIGISYSPFLNISGNKKGCVLKYKNSPEAEGIVRSFGGIFPDF